MQLPRNLGESNSSNCGCKLNFIFHMNGYTIVMALSSSFYRALGTLTLHGINKIESNPRIPAWFSKAEDINRLMLLQCNLICARCMEKMPDFQPANSPFDETFMRCTQSHRSCAAFHVRSHRGEPF